LKGSLHHMIILREATSNTNI